MIGSVELLFHPKSLCVTISSQMLSNMYLFCLQFAMLLFTARRPASVEYNIHLRSSLLLFEIISIVTFGHEFINTWSYDVCTVRVYDKNLVCSVLYVYMTHMLLAAPEGPFFLSLGLKIRLSHLIPRDCSKPSSWKIVSHFLERRDSR